MIWLCECVGYLYASLVSGGGLFYASGEWGESLAIDPTCQGDVTKTHIKWKHTKTPQGFGSPIIVGDYVYRASPPGVIRCWKLSDGQAVFEDRVEGLPIFPSPVATKNGRIYFARPGKSLVIK